MAPVELVAFLDRGTSDTQKAVSKRYQLWENQLKSRSHFPTQILSSSGAKLVLLSLDCPKALPYIYGKAFHVPFPGPAQLSGI